MTPMVHFGNKLLTTLIWFQMYLLGSFPVAQGEQYVTIIKSNQQTSLSRTCSAGFKLHIFILVPLLKITAQFKVILIYLKLCLGAATQSETSHFSS